MQFLGLALTLRQQVGLFKNLNPSFGEDYWKLCNLLPLMGGLFVCEDCLGELQIIDTVCTDTEEYEAGHRAVWRCTKCGAVRMR